MLEVRLWLSSVPLCVSKQLVCSPSGNRRVLLVIITSKVNISVKDANGCHPFLGKPIPTHAAYAARVPTMKPLISLVFDHRDRSQINHAIVGWLSIDVVDHIRPFAMMDSPCHPMSRETPVIDFDLSMTMSIDRCARLSLGVAGVPPSPVLIALEHIPRSVEPCQLPRVRIIGQDIAKGFDGG